MNRTVVVHSVPDWLPQTQNWMYTQVRYLPEQIEPHIVCEKKTNAPQFDMPFIHCLGDEPQWRSYWDRGLRKIGVRRHLDYLVNMARKHEAQILHSHFGHYGWAEIGAGKKTGLKHVVTFYGLDVNFLPRQDPRWRTRYPRLFEHVDLILCEGPHMASCITALGCPREKVHVQHLGIRVDEIEFKPRTWQRGEPLRVLIAASFREKKGIPYALEALGRIQKQVALEITIIGDADKEPRNQQEKEKIRATIAKHGFEKIHLLGYQPQSILMEEAYNHHIFLSPSITASDGDTEGGAPVSLIEMAASGMLIVSTSHCDIPEIVQHKTTGLLTSERNVDGLVENLTWLIDHPDAWTGMLRDSRAHVAAQYDARKQGERLASKYEELVCA